MAQPVYTRAPGARPSMTHERRCAPRYPLIASADITEPQTDTRLKARTSDVSLVGCYVDSPNPLPVATEMKLQIVHHDATFTALGIVAYSQPNMGIRFTDVHSDQQKILENWLAELV